MSDPEVVPVQPYIEHNGVVQFGPPIQAIPYTNIGFIADYHTKSLLVMLHNKPLLQGPSEEHVPAAYMREKDLAQLILGLQQQLSILRTLPSPPESEPNA